MPLAMIALTLAVTHQSQSQLSAGNSLIHCCVCHELTIGRGSYEALLVDEAFSAAAAASGTHFVMPFPVKPFPDPFPSSGIKSDNFNRFITIYCPPPITVIIKHIKRAVWTWWKCGSMKKKMLITDVIFFFVQRPSTLSHHPKWAKNAFIHAHMWSRERDKTSVNARPFENRRERNRGNAADRWQAPTWMKRDELPNLIRCGIPTDGGAVTA